MTDGTLETIDGRPALRFERHLPHPPQRVWRAVTEPAELERWFVAPVPWTPALNETFEGEGQHGRITKLEPPHVIRWDWGGERFAFELRSAGDGCVLVFTHVFDDTFGGAAQHAAGWETYFVRLDAHLAGGWLSEERAHEAIGERHERYAARFGADPAPGRRMIAGIAARGLTLEDGPMLRLERRYEHSVQRLWQALTDPQELDGWFPAGEPLEVSESEPPLLLAGTWFGDALRFELRPDGDGCLLSFTHAFADRDTSARTAAGWDRCFARLDALFAGAPMSEAASLAEWLAVHERYAAAFDVDPQLGLDAYAARPLT
ncbi:MAG TPA: SRPBCC domain-containing protein [Solirubrobacteraceae bacterium]|jgi:uncharacterized protein YndB with AHSA1/START domain|nr:SRPBCC domain-containing protein [Solirubrobacteraceae bacterium]